MKRSIIVLFLGLVLLSGIGQAALAESIISAYASVNAERLPGGMTGIFSGISRSTVTQYDPADYNRVLRTIGELWFRPSWCYLPDPSDSVVANCSSSKPITGQGMNVTCGTAAECDCFGGRYATRTKSDINMGVPPAEYWILKAEARSSCRGCP